MNRINLNGTPEWIRTTDLLLRRQTLYPAELRAHIGSISIVVVPPGNGQTAIAVWYDAFEGRFIPRRGG